MFIDFFYQLKDRGICVSPTAFLTLHKALSIGLVTSLADFYTAARSILVKSERYFDQFDQVFAHCFQGAELPAEDEQILDDLARILLAQWLEDPVAVSHALRINLPEIGGLSPEALIEYFKDRLKEQTERHDGGSRWIGTGGTSPVGHSGYHPGGMRVGGVSRNQSAVKVAMERRYKDYALQGPLTRSMMGEALKRLRLMRPWGPKDRINVDESIYQTVKNAGEIQIVFDRSLKDRLKVILAVDNGGWSMDPYIPMVQALFDYARAQFKEMHTFFFHNTIYETLWEDPSREYKPFKINELMRRDAETRLIIVGDAAMAPYELMARDGSLAVGDRSGRPSIACLQALAQVFRHSIWLNPVDEMRWPYTQTTGTIARIFPMFELTIDGLEQAVARLMAH